MALKETLGIAFYCMVIIFLLCAVVKIIISMVKAIREGHTGTIINMSALLALLTAALYIILVAELRCPSSVLTLLLY